MLLAADHQDALLKSQIKLGQITQFGKDHQLAQVSDYAGYKQAIPIRDYELLKPYIEQVKAGKQNQFYSMKTRNEPLVEIQSE